MRRIIILIILLVSIKTTYCQSLYPEVFSCFGGYAKNENVDLTWTAGEPFYETATNNNNTLTQGFNQSAYISSLTGLNNLAEYKISCFPNPTSDFVNIRLKSEKISSLFLQIVDLQGKVLFSKKAGSSEEKLDFSSFAKGEYLLTISENKEIIKFFKIQKK
ncbi:MAG: T9SS type A sorting domain-containing protein [Paludibacter sp.]